MGIVFLLFIGNIFLGILVLNKIMKYIYYLGNLENVLLWLMLGCDYKFEINLWKKKKLK